jgi:hypothetical protein
MMTLPDFNQLPFEEKHKFVLGNKKLRLISHRYYYNQKVMLYDYGKFFIEVYYNHAREAITNIQGIALDDKNIDLYKDQDNMMKSGS